MKSLKNKYYFWRQKKRYKKFKNCSLPYPFWDKKRDTFEWVYFDEYRQTGYEIQTSLYEALGNVSRSGVTYHYEALMYGRNDPEEKEAKYQMIESHCHSFDKKTQVGKRYMVVNHDNEYCGTLEVISEEFIPFKELKAEMVDYKLAGYKTFLEYKKHLYQDYQERAKMFQEEFTEESLLTYLKVKTLEKF